MVLAACPFVLIYSTAPTLWVVKHTSYAAFAVEQNQLRTDDDDDDDNGFIIVSHRKHQCSHTLHPRHHFLERPCRVTSLRFSSRMYEWNVWQP